MRPQLLQHVRHDDLAPIRTALDSAHLDHEVRSFLLESAARLPQPLRDEWLPERTRTIAAAAGTELDLNSTYPLLVKTALQVLEATAQVEDVPLLARHLSSNSPGVAKAALAALALLDPDAAEARIRELIESPERHQTTRQAMEGFLRSHERGVSGN